MLQVDDHETDGYRVGRIKMLRPEMQLVATQ